MDAMQITIAFGFVNWFAVLGATVVTFLIGGLWYSPIVFGRLWIAENKFPSEGGRERNIGAVFVVAFVLQWFCASMMAAVLGPNSDLIYGIRVGMLVGVFFVGAAMGITYLFERKSWKLYAINAGYHAVAFTVMGAILGSWH